MTFESLLFLLLFLPLVLCAYWLAPRRAAWQNGILTAASWLFFWSWSPRVLPLLLLSTVANFFAARAIEAARPPEGAPAAASRRMGALLGLALAYDLGQLVLFKYLGFFALAAGQLTGLFGLPLSIAVPRLAAPLGISFWTLSQVGYLVDVYHGRAAASRSPLGFAVFSAFFPHLQAGPIARTDLLDQLAAPRMLSVEDLRAGAARFLRGYVGRFLVAAVLGTVLVDPAFAHAGEVSTARHWLGLVAYAGQVFCDFAGYSEMALGCAQLFGIRLRENFDAPLLALNLLDLWRRWHMSLTNWLFDYIFTPLMTGEGWLRGRLDLGFLLAFLVSGLWHGAAWTFVLWGGLQGLGLIAHRHYDEWYRGMCRRDRSYVAVRKRKDYRLAAWAITQGYFVLSLVPFRAPSLHAAAVYASGMLGGGSFAIERPDTPALLNLAASVGLFVFYHATRGRTLGLPAPARGLAYGLLIVYLAIYMPVAQGTFIYAQF